jgi:hypothetical protein
MKLNYFLPKLRYKVKHIFRKELIYNLTHFFIFNYRLPYVFRQQISYALRVIERDDHFTEVKFRCPLTNNPRIYNLNYGLSR